MEETKEAYSIDLYDTRRGIKYLLKVDEAMRVNKERVTPEGEEKDPQTSEGKLSRYDGFTERLVSSLAPHTRWTDLTSIEMELTEREAMAEIVFRTEYGSVDLPLDFFDTLRYYPPQSFTITTRPQREVVINYEISVSN